MRRVPETLVSLIVLFSFLMSFGVSDIGSKSLSHALEHEFETLSSLVDHHHPAASIHDNDPQDEQLGEVEHQLLHDVGHLQPPLIGASLNTFVGTSARTTPLLSHLPAIPTAELEPPFRPPRIGFPGTSPV